MDTSLQFPELGASCQSLKWEDIYQATPDLTLTVAQELNAALNSSNDLESADTTTNQYRLTQSTVSDNLIMETSLCAINGMVSSSLSTSNVFFPPSPMCLRHNSSDVTTLLTGHSIGESNNVKVVQELLDTEVRYLQSLVDIRDLEGYRYLEILSFFRAQAAVSGKNYVTSFDNNGKGTLENGELNIKEGYLKRLLDNDSIEPSMGKILFCNVWDLCNFHSEFLDRLKLVQDNLELLADCFMQNAETFQTLYASYCTNFATATKELDSIRTQNPNLWTALQECQNSLGHQLPLSTYLLKPVQRVLRYQLLLQELYKRLQAPQPSSPSRLAVRSALERMASVAGHINERKRGADRGHLLCQRLTVNGRVGGLMAEEVGDLVMEGELRLTGGRRGGSQRRVVLFQRVLVMMKGDGEDNVVKEMMTCNQLIMIDRIPQDPHSFHLLPLGTPKAQRTLQATSQQLKLEWTRTLRRLLLLPLFACGLDNKSGFPSRSRVEEQQANDWNSDVFPPTTMNETELDIRRTKIRRKSGSSVGTGGRSRIYRQNRRFSDAQSADITLAAAEFLKLSSAGNNVVVPPQSLTCTSSESPRPPVNGRNNGLCIYLNGSTTTSVTTEAPLCLLEESEDLTTGTEQGTEAPPSAQLMTSSSRRVRAVVSSNLYLQSTDCVDHNHSIYQRYLEHLREENDQGNAITPQIIEELLSSSKESSSLQMGEVDLHRKLSKETLSVRQAAMVARSCSLSERSRSPRRWRTANNCGTTVSVTMTPQSPPDRLSSAPASPRQSVRCDVAGRLSAGGSHPALYQQCVVEVVEEERSGHVTPPITVPPSEEAGRTICGVGKMASSPAAWPNLVLRFLRGHSKASAKSEHKKPTLDISPEVSETSNTTNPDSCTKPTKFWARLGRTKSSDPYKRSYSAPVSKVTTRNKKSSSNQEPLGGDGKDMNPQPAMFHMMDSLQFADDPELPRLPQSAPSNLRVNNSSWHSDNAFWKKALLDPQLSCKPKLVASSGGTMSKSVMSRLADRQSGQSRTLPRTVSDYPS